MNLSKIIIPATVLLLIVVPFGIFNNSDDIKAVELNDSTVGYYQSTTCKISLFEFYMKIIM